MAGVLCHVARNADLTHERSSYVLVCTTNDWLPVTDYEVCIGEPRKRTATLCGMRSMFVTNGLAQTKKI